MKRRSFWYKLLRFFVNIFYKKRTFEGLDNIKDDPVIIVSNHARTNGPLVAELQFPLKRLTWCTGNVLTKKEFIEHAKTDFWGKKPKYIKWLFNIFAHIIAPIGSSVFNSADIIGVYKDARLRNTFKQTVNALIEGYNIIIFPECEEEYNNIVNQFQDKYIDVAVLYYRKTGKCLEFVPMYNAVKLKKVILGKGIKYDPNIPIEEQRKIINDYLTEKITNLAVELPKHKVVNYSNQKGHKNSMSK